MCVYTLPDLPVPILGAAGPLGLKAGPPRGAAVPSEGAGHSRVRAVEVEVEVCAGRGGGLAGVLAGAGEARVTVVVAREAGCWSSGDGGGDALGASGGGGD